MCKVIYDLVTRPKSDSFFPMQTKSIDDQALIPDSLARLLHCTTPLQRLKMDVIKGEEAKRVASGGGHFRATSDELGCRLH